MHQYGTGVVAELQGLDGSFSFAEKLLQKVWHRGDFDQAGARTAAGEGVSIASPGKWNRLGGPDFLGARVVIGGRLQVGDVELHLHAADWRGHGHMDDPKYRDVVLHVVLYPTEKDALTVGWSGRQIPILALLPLLNRSLEEYADEEAVERLANHPLAVTHEMLAALPPSEARDKLTLCAEERWREKVKFARARVERLGWTEACHQSALEVLGYRFNRGPMLLAATAHPLPDWRTGGRGAISDDVFEQFRDRWNLHPVRPANHPRFRLRQYEGWARAVPDWPVQLLRMEIPDGDRSSVLARASTGRVRSRPGFVATADRIRIEICGRFVGGSRFDTLVCNAFFPLMAARRPEDEDALLLYWRHWYLGDLPAKISQQLRALGLIGQADWPASNGIAQGLLGWIWREEERADQTAACLCGRGT